MRAEGFIDRALRDVVREVRRIETATPKTTSRACAFE
jgi:hypothetical protein